MTTHSRKAPHYRELQMLRLAEVRAMTVEEWQALLSGMRQPGRLPKLREHFQKHGRDFADSGTATPEEYQLLFFKHLQRSDLELFTYVSTQQGTRYRYWVFVGMDNRFVALYNEDRERYWSFFRPDDLTAYLESGRNWWLKVVNSGGKPRVRRW